MIEKGTDSPSVAVIFGCSVHSIFGVGIFHAE